MRGGAARDEARRGETRDGRELDGASLGATGREGARRTRRDGRVWDQTGGGQRVRTSDVNQIISKFRRCMP